MVNLKLKSLRSQILFSFVGTVTLILLIIVAMSYQSSRTIEQAKTKHELELGQRAFQDFLKNKTLSFLKQARLLTSDYALKEAFLSRDPKTIASALINHQKRIRSPYIALIDLEGVLHFESNFGEGESLSLRNNAYIKNDSLGKEDLEMIDSEGKVYQLVSVPLKAPLPIASIVIGFRIDEIISHEFYQFAGLEINFFNADKSQTLYQLDNLNEKFAIHDPHEDNRKHYVQFSEQKKLGLVFPVKELDQKIIYGVLTHGHKEVFKPLQSMQNAIVGIASFGLIFFFLLAYYMVKALSAPIERLKKSAESIAGGNLEEVIDERSSNEVYALSQSLNRMTDSLKDQIVKTQSAYKKLEKKHSEIQNLNDDLDRKLFETEVLLDIARQVKSEKEPEDLLCSIVETVMSRFQILRGSIFLADEKTNHFICHTVLKNNFLTNKCERLTVNKELEFSLDSGIAGKAYRTSKVFWSDNPKKNSDFVKKGELDHERAYIMCIPLVIKNKTIGVINFSNPENVKSLSLNDIPFFKTIATNIAMIIDNENLFVASITDGMTGLYNNKYFREKLGEHCEDFVHKENEFSLILFDIDHFKKFNDTYGHQLGDKVIINVAEKAKEALRTSDMLCRYGGEEFAIILPKTKIDTATQIAERVRQSIEESVVESARGPLKVTISMGVNEIDDKNLGPEDMIKRSDLALYAAKDAGRNNVQVFDPEKSSKIAA